jgi:hypothetical protein
VEPDPVVDYTTGNDKGAPQNHTKPDNRDNRYIIHYESSLLNGKLL